MAGWMGMVETLCRGYVTEWMVLSNPVPGYLTLPPYPSIYLSLWTGLEWNGMELELDWTAWLFLYVTDE